MGSKVNKEKMCELAKKGRNAIGNFAIDFYNEELNRAGDEAFDQAIEIGKEKTIAALYDAKVNDREIVRVVKEYWEIDTEEVEERLIWEKQEAAIRSLRQYLKLEGYDKRDINEFMLKIGNDSIRQDKELWKLKDNPEKLYNILKNYNKK